MAVFRRKPKVPEWASFMTPEEYARFLDAVRATLDERGTEYTLDDGTVRTPEGTYGLLNLAQQCRGEDDMRAIVGDHFARTAAGMGQMPETWEEAEPLLRARLAPMEIVETGRMVHRPVADLALVLACDFPQTVSFVTEEDAAGWGRPHDELFDIGLRQVREREEPPTVEPLGFEDGVALTAIHGESMFVTAHALWLEDGLLAIPHRHAILHHEIRDLSVVQAIGYMAQMAHGMEQEGPGSISDQLYFKRGDELIHLPVGRERGEVQFYPPDEFVELMNGLSEPAG